MINCIIVEDELPAREELKYFLNEEKEIKLIEEFESPLDTLNFLEKNKIDVVFLDINMPDMNGINLGKIISKIYPEVKIIFITAYKDYAVDAFEVKAFDYLLKPYSEERIRNLLKSLVSTKSVDNILNRNTSLKKITINMDEKIYVLSLTDVDYIEANEKETLIFANKKRYVSKIKISKWEEMLEGYNFYRCHRSYIINLDKIVEIEQWFNSSWIIKLKNYSTTIPVSRNNIKELKELFLT
ncbi:LytTR family DNA-binding domain-containing protein [Fusobacterium massiliense]|jgi:two-component response regulator|uniref:LytR/AlgR family response regulator transcription factor n=1 Tax=Fusobacterium massiliense TaxID=1852365 RepID=UPI0028D135E4|nr:LytTR family DNA-binding domain-containing protein [Fusobacterium massiliense]